MKLSEHTKKILENFASINSGLLIRKTPENSTETLLRTIERQGAIYGQAIVKERFETNVTLYDLGAFINVLHGFKDPDFTFNEDHVIVSEGKASAKITYCEPDTIIYPKKDNPTLTTVASFDVSEDSLAEVMKFSKILSLPSLRIFSKDGKLIMQAVSKILENSSTYDVEIGDTDKDIDVYVNMTSMKIISGDYNVAVSDRAITMSNLVDKTLMYLIPLDVA